MLYGWSSTLIVRTLEEAVSVSLLGSSCSLSIGPVKDEEASRQIGDGSRRKKKRVRADGERERRREREGQREAPGVEEKEKEGEKQQQARGAEETDRQKRRGIIQEDTFRW